jgi:8-oxo-dGTP pyrophosphatase MutT (NUDIX family)
LKRNLEKITLIIKRKWGDGYKMKYRKSLFIVTYAKTKKGIRYLILKRKLHWIGWEFPKGGRRFYETKKRTTKRELKEETGLDAIKIKKFNFSGKFDYDKEYPDRKGFKGQTYILYSAEVKKPDRKIKLSEEHSDYRWLNFEDAVKKIKWENQKNSLKIVNDSLKKT